MNKLIYILTFMISMGCVSTTNPKTVSENSVWLISDIYTNRKEVSGRIFNQFVKDLRDSKIYIYDNNIAEIILPSGKRSTGYILYSDKSSIRFYFDDSIPGVFDRLDLKCNIINSNEMFVSDGFSEIKLKYLGKDVKDKPIEFEQKKARRVQVIDYLEKQKVNAETGSSSSDGAADRPGIQENQL